MDIIFPFESQQSQALRRRRHALTTPQKVILSSSSLAGILISAITKGNGRGRKSEWEGKIRYHGGGGGSQVHLSVYSQHLHNKLLPLRPPPLPPQVLPRPANWPVIHEQSAVSLPASLYH